MESAEEMHTKDIQFSQEARDELQVLEDAVQDILNLSLIHISWS